jgi:hypothetical protein
MVTKETCLHDIRYNTKRDEHLHHWLAKAR